MTSAPVGWPDPADAVIRGDLTVAVAYVTPAGGTVVTSVSPVGLADREAGTLSFTTSLGFPKKLERILRDPRVSLAYHTREHGFAASSSYALAQGTASVDLRPSPERLAELMRASEPFLGGTKRGPVWDWLLREYHQERVFVDVKVERAAVWPDLAARGAMTVTGAAWPDAPPEQKPPKNGTGPRVDVAALARQIGELPHRVLAYRGADGLPVILPVAVTGHEDAGLRLDVPPGLLPPGGRRAGFLAHSFRPQCIGLSMRTLTGWLTVSDEGVLYAPHTSKGLAAPPYKTLLTASNGLLAKYGLWRAHRDGTAARLQHLAARGPVA
ncbi:hypothetical protein ACWGQ5_20935 [Streptomyces sp. NPDC055722]